MVYVMNVDLDVDFDDVYVDVDGVNVDVGVIDLNPITDGIYYLHRHTTRQALAETRAHTQTQDCNSLL